MATRQRACRLYSDLLGDVDGLTLPATDFRDVAPFIYYVRVLNGRRDALKQALLERGVDTGIHWIPGHQFSFFKDCRGGDLSVTERIGSEILTLPLHSFMEVQTVERVAAAISASLRMARAA